MTSELIQHNKRLVWDFWQQIDATPPDDLPEVAADRLADDVAWTGFHP